MTASANLRDFVCPACHRRETILTEVDEDGRPVASPKCTNWITYRYFTRDKNARDFDGRTGMDECECEMEMNLVE